MDATDALSRGREAYARKAWAEAYVAFCLRYPAFLDCALSLMRQPRIGRSVRIEGCPRTSNHRIYMRARAVHLAGQGIESPYVNTPASQIGIRSPSSSMNTRSRVGTSMKT